MIHRDGSRFSDRSRCSWLREAVREDDEEVDTCISDVSLRYNPGRRVSCSVCSRLNAFRETERASDPARRERPSGGGG